MIDDYHPDQRDRRKFLQQERSLVRSMAEAAEAKTHGYAGGSAYSRRTSSLLPPDAADSRRGNLIVMLRVQVHKAVGLSAADYDEKSRILSSD
eukprot:5585986-Prymnesium_polylepis.1